MKKQILILLALCLCLAACGREESVSSAEEPVSTMPVILTPTPDPSSPGGQSAGVPAVNPVLPWAQPAREEESAAVEAAEEAAPAQPAEEAPAAESPAALEPGSAAAPAYLRDDLLFFGRTEQNNNPADGPEPLAWRILADEGESLLLISDLCIDARAMNENGAECTWETSSIRAWLNGPFYAEAFSDEEKALIAESGAETADRVYILSAAEAEQYFGSHADAEAEGSAFAVSRGVTVGENRNTSPWMTRTAGKTPGTTVAFVNSAGNVNYEGVGIGDASLGIRPVIRVRKSSPQMLPVKTAVPVNEAAVGDYVNFGRYEQDGDLSDGAEPLPWIVLEKKDNSVLLLSRRCIDCMAYGDASGIVTWETSQARAWLNGEFVAAAFSDEEQARLQPGKCYGDRNKEYPTGGKEETVDIVFLLAAAEAEIYLPSSVRRMAVRTEYALSNGIYVSDEEGEWSTTRWYLRTPGETEGSTAVYVNSGGVIKYQGIDVTDSSIGIRPAIRVSIG